MGVGIVVLAYHQGKWCTWNAGPVANQPRWGSAWPKPDQF
jgi:hypothetical protein